MGSQVDDSNPQVVRNLLSGLIGAVGIGLCLGGWALLAHWIAMAPTSPDPPSGYTFEEHAGIFGSSGRGGIVYFTRFQSIIWWVFAFGGLGLYTAGGYLMPKRRLPLFVETQGQSHKTVRDDPLHVARFGLLAGFAIALSIIVAIDPDLFAWGWKRGYTTIELTLSQLGF
jgi:hypothetical protein